MFLNIIMFLCCYPIMLIVFFFLWNAGDKTRYCFGAKLPKNLRDDEALEKIQASYKKKMKNTAIISAWIPFVTFLIPGFSISFSIWMMWILVLCFIPMVYYAQANKKVLALKEERGWQEVSQVSYGDLQSAITARRVKFVTFLPAIIVGVLPIVPAVLMFVKDGYGAYVWIVVLFALMTVLHYAAAIWTDRQRVTVICEDSDINSGYARAKRQVWKNLWLQCIWTNVVFTWCILLSLCFRDWLVLGLIGGSVVYGIVVCVFAVRAMNKIMTINRKYEKHRTVTDAADDDRHWIWGLFYYNKKDKNLMVENRMGTGTTFNMAKGAGVWTNVFATLVILAMPFMCIWLIMMEYTPIHTVVENNTIVCEHMKVDYELKLEDIEDYEVLTELPKLSKRVGNGMENIYSGSFDADKIGKVELFLNPQNQMFLKLRINGKFYMISGADDAQTQVILDAILEYKK